jgi:hypothetical protein
MILASSDTLQSEERASNMANFIERFLKVRSLFGPREIKNSITESTSQKLKYLEMGAFLLYIPRNYFTTSGCLPIAVLANRSLPTFVAVF